MSVRVMFAVWDGFPGSGSDLLAMLALADWGDDDGGRIYPSMSAIAKKIRCDRRQAQRIVHKLLADGYLCSEGNDKGGSHQETRRYRINLDRLTGDVHVTGGADVTGDANTTPRVTSMTRTGGMGVTQTIKEPLVTVIPVSSRTAGRVAKLSECPHQKIIDLYLEYLPDLPKPKAWESKARKGALKTLWVKCSKAGAYGNGYSTLEDGLDFWGAFFDHVARNTKLPSGFGADRDWRPDLEWLVNINNFTKTMEGKYDH